MLVTNATFVGTIGPSSIGLNLICREGNLQENQLPTELPEQYLFTKFLAYSDENRYLKKLPGESIHAWETASTVTPFKGLLRIRIKIQ